MDHVVERFSAAPTERVRCGFCNTTSRFDEVESALVPSNVRRCSNESFLVWRCPRCGSPHSLGPEDLSGYYAKYPIFDQTLSYPIRSAFRCREWHMRSLGVKRGSKILDYGCAGGLFVDYLSRRGFETRGYDPNVDRYATLPAEDERFDAIVTYDVIEHVEEPQDMMRSLARRCRPGGIVIVGPPRRTPYHWMISKSTRSSSTSPSIDTSSRASRCSPWPVAAGWIP